MELIRRVSSIKIIVYLLSVAIVAFLIQSTMYNTQSKWLIWSALLVALLPRKSSFWRHQFFALTISIAMAFVAIFTSLLLHLPLLLACYLMFLTMFLMYQGSRRPDVALGLLYINLFAILPIGEPISLHEGLMRGWTIIAGGVIALLMQFILFVNDKRNSNQQLKELQLRQLQQLTNDIFNCFLQPEYGENIYLYEKRLHEDKTKITQLFSQLACNNSKSLTQKLKQIYALLLDCAQLRRRVTDHTTFGVCKQDLTVIHQVLNKIFIQLIQNKKALATDELRASIQRLEETYQSVMHIAAREPLVFLLFIESLKTLAENLEEIDSLETNPNE